MKQSIHGDWEQKERCSSPGEMAAAQVDADPNKRRMKGAWQMNPDRQIISGGTGSGTDGGVGSVDTEGSEKMAKAKPKPPGEQMERYLGSETTKGGRSQYHNKLKCNCVVYPGGTTFSDTFWEYGNIFLML